MVKKLRDGELFSVSSKFGPVTRFVEVGTRCCVNVGVFEPSKLQGVYRYRDVFTDYEKEILVRVDDAFGRAKADACIALWRILVMFKHLGRVSRTYGLSVVFGAKYREAREKLLSTGLVIDSGDALLPGEPIRRVLDSWGESALVRVLDCYAGEVGVRDRFLSRVARVSRLAK